MPQPEYAPEFWKEAYVAAESLQRSLRKLQQQDHAKYGLSGSFLQEVRSEEEALQHCEKAMQALSNQYVNHLEAAKNATSAGEALEALNAAETIWHAEAKIIHQFDKDKQEVAFLQEMRGHTLTFLQEELDKAARRCMTHTSDENIAWCIGLLANMDAIYAELGYPKACTERRTLREIATNFK